MPVPAPVLSDERSRARTPEVSVIIGAYNAMPYLTACVDSVVNQSIGPDRMEIITVDDGSTDGTGAELDRISDENPGLLRVVHQENSGGPAGPRNTGLDMARGRYVFFLDADDYLGIETLERMVAMAEEHDSDVVLGKMVGVGGRRAPALAYSEHRTHATVFDSRVYWNLTVMKLFRRELIERLGLRFLRELKLRQDQPFCATAYLHASNISVLTDYDCVYWVFRDDGANITRRIKGTEYRVQALRVMLELLGREVPAGPDRDRLLYRHLTTELRATLTYLHEEEMAETERLRLFEELRGLLTTWHSEAAVGRLPAIRRLHHALVRHGTPAQLSAAQTYTRQQMAANGEERLRNSQGLLPEEILVEEGRAYARYPFFRSPEISLPDSVFDCTRELRATHRLDRVTVEADGTLRITGRAGLERVRQGRPTITAVWRQRGSTAEYSTDALPTGSQAAGEAGPPDGTGAAPHTAFDVRLDPATAADGKPLPPGLWDLWLELRINGLRHRMRAGGHRGPDVATRPLLGGVQEPGGTGTTPWAVYYTAKHGNLTLDMGAAKHRPLTDLTVTAVRWAPGRAPAVRVAGTSRLAYPREALLVAATSDRGAVRTAAADLDRDTGEFQADLPLRAGTASWTLTLTSPLGGALPLAAPERLAPKRWSRKGLPWYAKQTDDEVVTLQVRRVRALRALLARLRR